MPFMKIVILSTALARPPIAKLLVEAAEEYGARHHGCTGKGNDQVHDVAIAALNPELKVLAPAREWGMSRETTPMVSALASPRP